MTVNQLAFISVLPSGNLFPTSKYQNYAAGQGTILFWVFIWKYPVQKIFAIFLHTNTHPIAPVHTSLFWKTEMACIATLFQLHLVAMDNHPSSRHPHLPSNRIMDPHRHSNSPMANSRMVNKVVLLVLWQSSTLPTFTVCFIVLDVKF